MSNIPSGFDLSETSLILVHNIFLLIIIRGIYRDFFSKEMVEKLSFNEEMEKLYKRWPLDYYSEQKSEWICDSCRIKNDLSYNICYSCSTDRGENTRIVKEDWQEAYYRILKESSFTHRFDSDGGGGDSAYPEYGLDSYLGRHNENNIFKKKARFILCILVYLVYLLFCVYFTYFSEFKQLKITNDGNENIITTIT